MTITKFSPKNKASIPKFSKAQIKKFENLKDSQLNYSDIEDFTSNPDFWKQAKIVKKSPKNKFLLGLMRMC